MAHVFCDCRVTVSLPLYSCTHMALKLTLAHSASYLSFRMVLCLLLRTRLQEKTDWEGNLAGSAKLDEDETSFRLTQVRDKVKEAITLAHQAAQILCDFRSRYGLKITPAWLLHLQAVTGSVLVLDQDLMEPAPDSSPVSKGAATSRITDSHTAFDEVFRSLLGTGVQVMISRGIARMMYHVALEQKISLSPSTRSLLQLMVGLTRGCSQSPLWCMP